MVSTNVPSLVPFSTTIFVEVCTGISIHDTMVKSVPQALHLPRGSASTPETTGQEWVAMDEKAREIRVRSVARKFVQIDHIVFEQYASRLTPSAFVLYGILKKFADYQTGECYPKIETVAAMMGTHRATVDRGLSELSKFGLIQKRSGRDEGRPNEYLIPDPQGLAEMPKGFSTSAKGGLAPVLIPNKEELEPLNENQLTLTPPASELKDSKAKKSGDPRHEIFKKMLCNFYVYLNPEHKASGYYWTAKDAGTLGRFLKQNSELTAHEMRDWLLDYRDSQNINPALKPYEFLNFIHRFKNGPLDQYGKPPREKHAAL